MRGDEGGGEMRRDEGDEGGREGGREGMKMLPTYFFGPSAQSREGGKAF